MKNIYVETYGCTSNKFDSEKMLGILQGKGYQITDREEEADYILVNSCAVKGTTEDKIIGRLEELHKGKKKIIVAGCLTKVNPKRILSTIPHVALVDPRSIHQIGEVVERVGRGEEDITAFSLTPEEKPALPGFSFSPVISLVKMAEGCLSNCTFCATKLARGNLISFRPESIREAFRLGTEKGFHEFHLTSEDASAYGRDLGVNLADLLGSLTRLDGDFKIRIGMMNPLHFLKRGDELRRLVQLYKNNKIFKFLHLCVQSGSDKILKEMRRGYCAEDFKKIVKVFRREIPEITIWTDIIVGFPGESDGDFKQTLTLAKEMEFDFINISRYAVRLGTLAARMKQISSEVKKERSKRLSEVMHASAIKKNINWIGWKGLVLIDEYNREKRSFIGRNCCYKPVVLREKYLKLGNAADVEIVDAKGTHLVGRVANDKIAI